ncbi:response regulator transcription factor [Rhizobium leguminosarum]|uniref:response regulator transcription factor n=1 Tax=Rhizobium leguminosarum TaxID=384 RepID=UPI0010326596|nr:response regulator [Rhizobium leguminosarum]QIO76245.1 response regulator [Rhizobium leguminosarum bv. trifolii]QIO83264.1 response regulator [Rhizobium leguminosarum bv. trifolii]TAU16482.1 response regulator [Rhizobium leguminosarum]TAU34823.1 response regulator [Rhizobium leguminosarum]TAX43997.1 response regulator [Rhizobium leguminosarum]
MTAKPSAPSSGDDQTTSIVYIVDDDVSVRESLEHLLQIAGWKPVAFSSAGQFLAASANPCPCCLILDINLPELDGLELQRLMAAERINIPTILVSGSEDERVDTLINAGAVGFLTKPINTAELLKTVSTALATWETVQKGASSPAKT